MKFVSGKLLYFLLLIAPSLIATTSHVNQPSNSSDDTTDLDHHRKMVATTMASIADEHSNRSASITALVSVSKQLLSSVEEDPAVDVGDDSISVRHISDISDVAKVDVTHVDENPLRIATTRNDDEMIIDNTIIGMRSMPDDATVWELLKAQVQADFGPILIIIPRPLKRLIRKNIVRFVSITTEALKPMLMVAGKILDTTGRTIIYVGEDIIRLSQCLQSLGVFPSQSATTALLEIPH